MHSKQERLVLNRVFMSWALPMGRIEHFFFALTCFLLIFLRFDDALMELPLRGASQRFLVESFDELAEPSIRP